MKVQSIDKNNRTDKQYFMLTCCIKSYLDYPNQTVWLNIASKSCGVQPYQLEEFLRKKVLTRTIMCDRLHNMSYGALRKIERFTKNIEYNPNLKKTYCVCNMYKRKTKNRN